MAVGPGPPFTDSHRSLITPPVAECGTQQRRPRCETFYSEKPAWRPPSAAAEGSASACSIQPLPPGQRRIQLLEDLRRPIHLDVPRPVVVEAETEHPLPGHGSAIPDCGKGVARARVLEDVEPPGVPE